MTGDSKTSETFLFNRTTCVGNKCGHRKWCVETGGCVDSCVEECGTSTKEVPLDSGSGAMCSASCMMGFRVDARWQMGHTRVFPGDHTTVTCSSPSYLPAWDVDLDLSVFNDQSKIPRRSRTQKMTPR